LSQSAALEVEAANAGFTLIEVLIALAIVAISLAALGSLMASNRRVATSLDTHLSLVETARGIETALPDRAALVGNLSGESGDYRWGVFVRPFASNLVDPRVPTPWVPQGVSVRVQSPEGVAIQVDTVRLQKRAAP
jgi:general secretion pathway protein I